MDPEFAATTVTRGVSITAMQIIFLVKSAVMLCRDADGGDGRCAGSNIHGPGGPVVRLLGAGIYLFRQNTHIIYLRRYWTGAGYLETLRCHLCIQH